MFQILGEEQHFKQWEQGKMVVNPCMQVNDQVVFRNSSGATFVMYARNEGGQVVADVPNKLLQQSLNILVDLGQGLERHTECRTAFEVVAAVKPDDYEFIDNAKHVHPSIPEGVVGVTSWNDLPDRPFGESENAVLLPETELIPQGSMEIPGSSRVNTFATDEPIEFVAGKTYTVNWNGMDYETVSFMGVNPMAGSLEPMVGNPAPIGGENNNLPFIIGGNGIGILAVALDGSTSVVVSIKGHKIERLPEKYMPIQEPYVYEKDFNKFEENSTEKMFDSMEPQLPLALLEAIYQRKPIYMKVRTKKDDGTYDSGELNGPVSFSGNYKYIALGLMFADKTSEIFEIPEGTVYNGMEFTTQQLLAYMGIRISARFPCYVNGCRDFLVWFIDPEGLD